MRASDSLGSFIFGSRATALRKSVTACVRFPSVSSSLARSLYAPAACCGSSSMASARSVKALSLAEIRAWAAARNRWIDAMRLFARAKSLIASIHRLRAAAHARISANDKAFTDLALAIELDPQHAAGAYNDRAKLEDTLGNRTQAVTDFRKAVALDPNMKEPRESLARMGLGR